LLAVLSSSGNKVYEISVRIEAGITGYPEQGSEGPSSHDAAWLRPSPRAAETVRELALTVGETPLGKAVERLARTLEERAKR
jgi:hypothetical protein